MLKITNLINVQECSWATQIKPFCPPPL